MKSMGKVVGFLPAHGFFGPKLTQCEGSIFQEEFSRELQAYMASPHEEDQTHSCSLRVMSQGVTVGWQPQGGEISPSSH